MSPKSEHYLDWNSAAPLARGVSKEISDFLEASGNGGFDVLGNPSSIHSIGAKSARRIRLAKADVAITLSAQATDLIFCSSGTEALHYALHSALFLMPLEQTLLIHGAADHTAVRSFSALFEKSPLQQFVIPVTPDGILDWSSFEKPKPPVRQVIVSTLWVNNETGVIADLEPVRNQVEWLRGLGLQVTWILDAAQAWGKIPVTVHDTGADAIAFSGAKIGALPGSGVLWLKSSSIFRSVFPGTQQGRRRGGTESVLGAIALGEASRGIDLKAQLYCHDLRNEFEQMLLSSLPQVEIHGVKSNRVSNTSNFSVPLPSAKGDWVAWLDLQGFQVSSGSACAAQIPEPSMVLRQMGVPIEAALQSIRVSIGPTTKRESLSALISVLQSRKI